MEHNLDLSKDCQARLKEFQVKCAALMNEVRNVVDKDTYDILSTAYSLTGNASREIGLLVEEIEDLRNK